VYDFPPTQKVIMEQPKFQMFDEVYFSGTRFWIIGINLKCGYDRTLWEYTIGKMLYDDRRPLAIGDKHVRENIRDEQLMRPEEWKLEATKELEREIEEKQQELNKLKEDLKAKSASTCTEKG